MLNLKTCLVIKILIYVIILKLLIIVFSLEFINIEVFNIFIQIFFKYKKVLRSDIC